MTTAQQKHSNNIKILFLATFTLTLARAISLPYLVIYLSNHFFLNISTTGVFIGSTLLISSILSIYGGFLVDKLSSFSIITLSTTIFIVAFITAYLSHDIKSFYISLVAVNLSYATIDIAIKSGFSILLPDDKRGAAFSFKYTLSNIAYAIGPLLGAGLISIDGHLSFITSAALALFFILTYLFFGRKSIYKFSSPQPISFFGLIHHLIKDSRLVYFTLGGMLSAIIFGQFTAYLSQYLLSTSAPEQTTEIISIIVTTNALTVIALQYFIGRRINNKNLLAYLMLGLGLFLIGLYGFSISITPLAWVIAMIFFTLGEIIVIPAEYMFIDRIAPENLRGIYYGAQNFSNFGAALGPILCGFALATYPPNFMFFILEALILFSGLFYFLGSKKTSTNKR